ncbi:MAG: hypothetical protein ABI689_13480, partial [Thermoanaerobaculia bacterium]
QITDMQQSLRVAQYDMVRTTRLAGRGGIPAAFRVDPDDISIPWLRGLAVEVRDNVAAGGDNQLALGTTDPQALPGTDILTLRGCLTGLMFQMETSLAGDFTPTTLTIRRQLVNGRSQDLSELLESGFSGPMLLQSAANRNLYAIAEVNSVAGNSDTVTLQIAFASTLTPPNPLITPPPADFAPAFTCVLDEFRYYVRQNFETPGDNLTPLKPRLTRARMIPGTETPYARDVANLSLDLADDIFDLQIALGFDTDYDSAASGVGSYDDDTNAIGPDDTLFEGANDIARATDDWLGNSSGDNPQQNQYRVNAAIPGRPAKLYFVRISTLARTARRDPKYTAPDFDPTAGEDFVENNDYDQAPANFFKQPENRQFRHRILQTVVALRNL